MDIYEYLNRERLAAIRDLVEHDPSMIWNREHVAYLLGELDNMELALQLELGR